MVISGFVYKMQTQKNKQEQCRIDGRKQLKGIQKITFNQKNKSPLCTTTDAVYTKEFFVHTRNQVFVYIQN